MSARVLVLDRRLYLEDVEFVAAQGACWPEVERRVGFCRKSIDRACERAGRRDIPRRINANAKGIAV